MQTVYHQFALLLVVAAIFGAIALSLRQRRSSPSSSPASCFGTAPSAT